LVTLGVADVARSTAFYLGLGWPMSNASVEGNVSFFQLGTVVKQPERVFWGGYSGYVADPDGHLWELAHNPGFTLTSDGTVQLP
jgi:catechol 2,3-dioxygenase-like lactoylglutathione lyase family enzyme